MSWQNFSDFFSQLFTSLTVTDSLVLLLALLGAYLIGWFFTRLYYRKKLKRQREEIIEKDKMLSELNIRHESLESELDLKTADLKKAELALEHVNRDLQALSLDKESWLQVQQELQSEIERLQTQLAAAETEEVDLDELSNNNEIVDGSTTKNNFNQFEMLLRETEKRMAALESRVQYLESEEQNVIIVEADDLEDIEEGDEDESDYFTLTRVEEAKKIINEKLGENIHKSTLAEKDDLKKINGIGPFIEQKLNALGIYTFKQVSQFDPPFIQSLTEAIQFFPGRIERDDWVGQAKKLL